MSSNTFKEFLDLLLEKELIRKQVFERMSVLPTWQGLPVPKFVTWRTDGVPDFKVIDEEFRETCATQKLCFICGTSLEYWIFFIGGPRSTAQGLFVDGPMHKDCANAAMEFCPFLRGDMDYVKHWDFSKHDKKIEFTAGDKRNLDQKAPEEICITRCREFGIAIWRNPKKPDKGAWFFRVQNPKEITRKCRG